MRDAGTHLSGLVIGCAIEVQKFLGPGLLESVYENALAYELAAKNIPHRRQQAVPVTYKGVRLGAGYRADLIVDGRLLIEIKAVEVLDAVHTAQVITYLKLLQFKRGLLINFNVTKLTNGIKRISI